MEKHRKCLLSEVPATWIISRIFPTDLSGFSGRYKYFLVNKTKTPLSQQSAPEVLSRRGLLPPVRSPSRKGPGVLRLPFVRLKRRSRAPTEMEGFLGFCRCERLKTRHRKSTEQPASPGKGLRGQCCLAQGRRGLSRNTEALQAGMSRSGGGSRLSSPSRITWASFPKTCLPWMLPTTLGPSSIRAGPQSAVVIGSHGPQRPQILSL